MSDLVLWVPIKLEYLQFVKVLCCHEGGDGDRVGGVRVGLGRGKSGQKWS